MSQVKTIVCLANSRKLSGRCVAGREFEDGAVGRWVRPVSRRPHQEVSEYERQYENGGDPQVLDLIAVPIREWQPATYQQENWLLDDQWYWVRVGRIAWSELALFAREVGPLWVNGQHTYHGRNDVIAEAEADALTSSLRLIRVEQLRLRTFAPSAAFGNNKRRLQAEFRHEGVLHRLWVTDPVYERRYLSRPDGQHDLGECYLTVSLGEPYDGKCYKLVAAIIEPTGAPGLGGQ